MKTCYIVGAGDFFGDLAPKDDDLLIAADGGLDTLKRKNIRCDILLGDMDSVKADSFVGERYVFPVEKDETDSFLAYYKGVEKGYENFRIYGGVGGRIDHTFANFSLLIYGKNQNHSLTLVADGYEIFAIKNEKISLCGQKGKTFSVFAFGSDARGVSIKGGKYEGENLTLTPDFPLGISNSFTEDSCEIEVCDGTLLVMKEI